MDNRFKRKLPPPPDRALPDNQTPPAAFQEHGGNIRVPPSVAIKLRRPEPDSGARETKKRTGMAVPETAMNEDGSAKSREDQIRSAGNIAGMEAVTKPPCM